MSVDVLCSLKYKDNVCIIPDQGKKDKNSKISSRYLSDLYDKHIFYSDGKYEESNVQNYYLLKKCVLNIYKEVKTLELSYFIVASNWNGNYNVPSLKNNLS